MEQKEPCKVCNFNDEFITDFVERKHEHYEIVFCGNCGMIKSETRISETIEEIVEIWYNGKITRGIAIDKTDDTIKVLLIGDHENVMFELVNVPLQYVVE